MMWLTLCDLAWQLYDQAILSGKWAAYWSHRKNCKECRLEIK